MPISYNEGDEPAAIFVGRCLAEEADIFLEWLRRTYEPVVDARACTDLHTALLQLLLCANLNITLLPADPFLASLLCKPGVKALS